MPVKLSSILPVSIKTPRLTLELYNSSEAHVQCCLAARNNPITYSQVGDLGCHTKEDLERRHSSKSIHLQKEVVCAGDVEIDTFVLYILRLDSRPAVINNDNNKNNNDSSSSISPSTTDENSPFIGYMHLHQWEDSPPELGYSTIPEFMGKGYTTEALIALCRVARETLRIAELTVTVYPTNHASRRVAEKAGFVFTGQKKAKKDEKMLNCFRLPLPLDGEGEEGRSPSHAMPRVTTS